MLSFFSIFGIQNNINSIIWPLPAVVNCFHFSVSLGYKTTYKMFLTKHQLLWIAFIFQYLWDTKQHPTKIKPTHVSCELLSFFSIFGIQNNAIQFYLQPKLVVNCFHFSVSLGYKTTKPMLYFHQLPLWIAFIFQYLWDTKQHYSNAMLAEMRCELLSFFSIFGIQNNLIFMSIKNW